MIKDELFKKLEIYLGEGRVKKEFILAPYTTFKMGGPAEYYFVAETKDDLVAAAKASKKLNLKLTVLGGVSNSVVSELGIKGLVVRNSFRDFVVVKDLLDYAIVKISSGFSMSQLVKETVERGLSGFEYHLGLPGTLGGALYMNSKWTNPESYVGDSLIEAEIISSSGKVRVVSREYFQFAYDYSILQETREVVISATFKMKKESVEKLRQLSKKSLDYRKETQPFGVASSGCFFRNINGKSAGYLIDASGLKGYSVGRVFVSPKHANFIINKGGATSDEVKKLVTEIRKRVKSQHGVDLKEEVVFIN